MLIQSFKERLCHNSCKKVFSKRNVLHYTIKLLIHQVSSPINVATLLYVLIRKVVFVVVFQDEFSTFCQSFIIVVVREGVTIRNPKTYLKSEVKGPDTIEERKWSAKEACLANGQARRVT
ncbi:hypothetical protein Q3G72_021073 [Acer saccharum]|nr:hypothetical protein Q3G72_021073 [Acer saccharum]